MEDAGIDDGAPTLVARGPVWGSSLFLWLIMELGTVAIVVIASLITSRALLVESVVGAAVLVTLLVPLVQRLTVVSVTDAGLVIRFRLSRTADVVGWESIIGIEAKRFSGSVVVEAAATDSSDAVDTADAVEKKVRFASLDPSWPSRPVATAILEALDDDRDEVAAES